MGVLQLIESVVDCRRAARFGSEQPRSAIAMAVAQVYDFSRIRVEEAQDHLFTPGHSEVLFDRHAAWLATQLAMPHDGPTVVITHHGPTPLSISPRC